MIRSVGVTGTEKGPTERQYRSLRRVLRMLKATFLRTGDCVGVDAVAVKLGRQLGYRTVGHPPDNPKLRAFEKYDVLKAPEPYLIRNRKIAASDVLIAVPKEYSETRRSGTWSTVRYARKAGTPILIIQPDGKVYRDRTNDDE